MTLMTLRLARSVHSRTFHDELVLVELDRGEYFALDAIGARIWACLAQDRSLDEIAAELEGEYSVDRARLDEDILQFVTELLAAGLLVETI